jgi:exonuclease SbcC
VTQTKAVLDQPDLQRLPEEPANVAEASARAKEADDLRATRTEWRLLLDGRAKRAQELTAKLKGELGRSADLQAEFDLIDQLARAARGEAPNQLGIPLESFVLAAELEEIVAAANGRLQTMSQGRYAIEHSDERTRGGKRTGLEIVVYDAHTGATRSPRSLSGGEKFLASLALALGMAEVVTNRAGGIQLDTLFIDEGFGALDNETLELAMQTLDELRQGGRTVGLISHVEAMKDQIPAKLLVGVTDGGWSVIDQST